MFGLLLVGSRHHASTVAIMNRRSALLFLTCSLPLAACAPARLYTGPLDSQPDGPYFLASGDRLRVIVFGQENLANIYTVDGDGRISVPLIGPVKVAGGTTEAAARAIETKLRAGFVREPKVTVEIEVHRPFFILGEVLNPGQFPFVSNMSVQTAVAIAGGFSPRADQTYAEITRPLREGLGTALVPITYPMKPGDTVVIKERWF
jgi:polysaccharide biosynthesis/export protein